MCVPHYVYLYLSVCMYVCACVLQDKGMPSRWAPGGSIKYVQSKDGVVWSSPVTVLEQGRDGVPKVSCVSVFLLVFSFGALPPSHTFSALPPPPLPPLLRLLPTSW
jgi:hypothetical protein